MRKTTLAANVLCCTRRIEAQNTYALIHRVLVELFHVVVLGLREVDAKESGQGTELVDIVVAASAKVHRTAAKALQKQTVIGCGKFTVHIGRNVHGAVVAQHQLAAMPHV